MTSYVQLCCPHCGEPQLIDQDKRFEAWECRKCKQTVNPPEPAQNKCAAIISDRIRSGNKMSSEFRDGVLNKIMSVKGANNETRKYG